ncbi:hypothetical protein UlMin_037291 [Ulmus minor]
MFISNRHGSIQKAVAKIFLRAIYGACVWHVEKNMKNKFKSKSAISIFNEAARAYKISEFTTKFSELERSFPHVHKFLMDVGIERWARALFHGDRYNIMTNNLIEALNTMLKKVREYPLLLLLTAIMEKMYEWFNDRHRMADNLTSLLRPEYEKILRDWWSIASTLVVVRINENEWIIQGNECDTMVDLLLKTCTCKQFDLEKLSYVHTVKAASIIGADRFMIVAWYFTARRFGSVLMRSPYIMSHRKRIGKFLKMLLE